MNKKTLGVLINKLYGEIEDLETQYEVSELEKALHHLSNLYEVL